MSQPLVGAGGWAYFQVPGSNGLDAYSRAFEFVELNSSYYKLPQISRALEWRRRVPSNFRFSVRCPRILLDRYGLRITQGSKALLERLSELCTTLDADVMTVLVKNTPLVEGDEDLSSRLKAFLEGFHAQETVVAIEFRDCKPAEEVYDIMKSAGAVHSVDLSKEQPRFESKVLYSRLFGKGEKNIYEFDDGELKEIARKASGPKFEKSILAFHGVRMYRDAGRVKSFIEKGYFPRITSGVGLDSVREVLSEDARFPSTKTRLMKDQGWKVFQDSGEVRRLSLVLETVPDGEYRSLDHLIAEMKNHEGEVSN